MFLNGQKLWFYNFSFFFQAGDGYLAGLAARFASELHFEEDDVLHQLEDLRSAATSEWPSIRSVVNPAASNNQRRMSETESHNYANYPGNLEDKSFLPGIYAVSSRVFQRCIDGYILYYKYIWYVDVSATFLALLRLYVLDANA